MGAEASATTRYFVGFCGALLMACGGEDSQHQAEYDDSGHSHEEVKCPQDWQPLTSGPSGTTVSDPATGASVRIDWLQHQPPNKGMNTWNIAITDQAGQPAAAARINWACAFMDVHGHGSNPKGITPLGPGVFELKDQNLSMFGPWAVRLWVDIAGTGPQYEPQKGSQVADGEVCRPTNGAGIRPNIQFEFCVPDALHEGT